MSHSMHIRQCQENHIFLDTTRDIRFMNNVSLVDKGIRIFAEFPLASSEKYIVGSFRILNTREKYIYADSHVRILERMTNVIMRGASYCADYSPVPPYNTQQTGSGNKRTTNAALDMQELLQVACSVPGPHASGRRSRRGKQM